MLKMVTTLFVVFPAQPGLVSSFLSPFAPPTRAPPWAPRVGGEVVRRRMSSDDSEVAEALRREAAKLREEADLLERSMAEERQAQLEGELAEFFEAADANRDGVVTFEELQSALRKRLVEDNENKRSAERLSAMLQGEALRGILQDLDANADGVLQRDEMISVDSFRERLEKNFRDKRVLDQKVTAKETVEKAVQERFAAFEAIANSTNVSTRAVAFLCFVLPLVDAIPVDLLTNAPPNPLSVAAVGAWVAYRNFPASGLVVFVILSAIASNAANPRLSRFAARHAIVLDFVAALVVPLAYRFAPPPFDAATALIFEAAVLACAVAALLGIDSDFIPGTGTLTKKFTDDYDDSVRSFIRASTTAELGAFVAEADDVLNQLNNTTTDEKGDDKDDEKKDR